jgi:hypothetical protein
MKDGIPLGNGTSRKIISSSENVPDTWEDFKSLLISEGLLIDLSINDSGWYDLGTRLNKANILTDETAERFGLDENATPDDVFKVIPVSSSSISWGRISGVIGDQEDLSEALYSKLPKSSVVQDSGESTTNIMSQKAVGNAITQAISEIPGIVVVQSTGNSTTAVMSQKAVTDAINSSSSYASTSLGSNESEISKIFDLSHKVNLLSDQINDISIQTNEMLEDANESGKNQITDISESFEVQEGFSIISSSVHTYGKICSVSFEIRRTGDSVISSNLCLGGFSNEIESISDSFFSVFILDSGTGDLFISVGTISENKLYVYLKNTLTNKHILRGSFMFLNKL